MMADEHHMPDNTGKNRKQIASWILMLLGPVGITVSLLLLELTTDSFEDTTPLILPLTTMLLASISSLLFVVGIILLFLGRSQAKKQKNQNSL